MKINKANLSYNSNNIPEGNKPTPPSFKGAPPVKLSQKVGDFFTLAKAGPMNRQLFILNAFAFLLGTRLVTSRDKDEIRETIIRDIPTIVIAVLGVPVAEIAIAKGIQKKSGIALTKDAGEKGKITTWFEKTILRRKPENINNKSNVASYNELKEWYQFDEKKLKSGFKGFLDRFDKLNGNLSKICSGLSDDIQNDLKDFSDTDNKGFMSKLFDGSEKSNAILNKLKTEFASNKNNVLRKALFKKTLTKMFAFAAPLTLVGLCIPKLNIKITETIHKGENAKKTKQEQKEPTKI